MRYQGLRYTLLALFCNGTLLADDSPAREEIQAYLEFATYGEGAITSEPVNEAGLSAFQFIDTQSPTICQQPSCCCHEHRVAGNSRAQG